MYLAFPVFGLGQGSFYRQSALTEFSGSEFLVGMAGEGVHNEFFRILIELGPIGLGLVLLIVIPFLRLGRRNLQWVSFYALVGIALGNVYTNAILVRELLTFSAVFAGSYFWEVHSSSSATNWRPPSIATTRNVAIALVVLTLAAITEVALSFDRFPFIYGQRCREVHALGKDGWTQGTLRVHVPPSAVGADLDVFADRPDLDQRPLDLDISVLSGSGTLLAQQRFALTARDSSPISLPLALPDSSDGKRFLEVKPSHCYVPLNLGITYDPRRLGVHVKSLTFRTAGGVEIR
jgi:hypothetical protein